MKYKSSWYFLLSITLALTLPVFFSSVSYAQQNQPKPAAQNQQKPAAQKPKMVFLGEFDAGQPNAGIFKLFDPTDEVVCYVLMPATASRKEVNGTWVYEANSLGSISCVKVNIPKSDVIRK